MNFFKFDNSDKSVLNVKPEVKPQQMQPQNVVRTVSQPAPTIAPATQPINTVKETTMSSYVDLQKQIAQLQSQAEQARKEEMSGIINQIKSQIREFGLTASDLGLGRKAGGAKVEKIVKYRDNQGHTWAGLADDGKFRRGQLPKWISDVRSAHGDNWLKYLEQFKV